MYQQPRLAFEGQEINCIKRISDNAFIPFAEGNTDYQQYLAWLAEGNTPEPAEENQQ